MKRKIKFVILFFVFVVIVGVLYLLIDWYTMEHIVKYPTSFVYYEDTGVYEIEPDMILEKIRKNDSNIFTIPTDESVLKSQDFGWNQEDFLEVATALNSYVWNDELTKWRLFYARFSLFCQNHQYGFSSSVLTYFQSTGMFSNYNTRRLGVYPSSNRVEWGGDGYFPKPPIFGWSSINLEDLKITADEAFAIAESNGGSDFREKVKNSCTIHVLMSPYMNNETRKIWHITYDTDYSERLEILVDSNNGETYKSE